MIAGIFPAREAFPAPAAERNEEFVGGDYRRYVLHVHGSMFNRRISALTIFPISAVSSDPTVIQIGTADASTPNIIPWTALQSGAMATITYTAAGPGGTVT
jgi:hypothetical protein